MVGKKWLGSKGQKIKDNILIGPETAIPTQPVNIAEVVLKALKSKPEWIGQVDASTNEETTYADMSDRSIKYALWLKKQGIKAGDIIGFSTDNNLDSTLVLLGALYLGATCSTWDQEVTTFTARRFLSITSPTVIFAKFPSSVAIITQVAKELGVNVKIVMFDKLNGYESLEDISRGHSSGDVAEFKCAAITDREHIAFLVFSSGTTGTPKIVEISHFSTHSCLSPDSIALLRGHKCLFTCEIRWYYGILMAFKAILAYSTRIIVPDDVSDDSNGSARLFEIIEKYHVTLLNTDPFAIIRFIKTDLSEKYRLPTLRLLIVVGAMFQAHYHEAITNKLPHVEVHNNYGCTDAAGELTEQGKDSKPGSVGFPRHNVQLKIADMETGKALQANLTGEIRVKVPFVMSRYYKNPEATKHAFDSDDGVTRTACV